MLKCRCVLKTGQTISWAEQRRESTERLCRGSVLVVVITPGSRKCAPFCTLPWHDWKTMVPWIGHFTIKCACTSQGKGALSITFSELSNAASAFSTHLQLHGGARLNLHLYNSNREDHILVTYGTQRCISALLHAAFPFSLVKIQR